LIPAALRRLRPASRTVAAVVLLASLIAVAVVTLTPTGGDEQISFWCLKCGERPAVDLLLNILLFVPLGAGLGLYGLRFRRAVVLALLCTCLVEALQFFVIPGRYASFRDILANFAGAVVGYLLGRHWRTIVMPGYGAARILATAAAILWLVTQAFTAWAMVISPPPEPWWSQLQPEHSRYPAVFTGRILELSVGSIQIRKSQELPSDDADAMRKRIVAGAPLKVAVTDVGPTRGRAPIAIISAGPVNDVAWWAEDGRDGVFGVAVRGTLLGLRTPLVRIADVVPRERGDTLRLSGSYRNGLYELRAENRDGVRNRELRASPSWGWAFLLPLQLYAFGSTVIWLTALYLAAVWCVFGYWNARSVGTLHVTVPVARMAIGILLGLGVAPMVFALPAAHWSEWLATMVGGAAGWAVARNQTKVSNSI
jgi:VanZ like protein